MASNSVALSSNASFGYDDRALRELQTRKPWLSNANHFTAVRLSTVAAIKMVSHAIHGVDQGRKHSATGAPIEIMGFCIGHLDCETPSKFIITDVFPLPVEGSETAVVAESPEVMSYQGKLVDTLEMTRKDRLIGWYHSHPFDIKKHSNCFFSMTDVITQRMFQNATDRNDFSFVGIVIDPLRTIAQGVPELGAFRAYPDTYRPPAGQAPDGKVWENENECKERWGNASLSYYALDIEYFQSALSTKLMELLSRDYLWARTLSAPLQSMRADPGGAAARIATVVQQLKTPVNASARAGTILSGELSAPQNSSAADELLVQHECSQISRKIRSSLFQLVDEVNSRRR